jgi:hypothetical protein
MNNFQNILLGNGLVNVIKYKIHGFYQMKEHHMMNVKMMMVLWVMQNRMMNVALMRCWMMNIVTSTIEY